MEKKIRYAVVGIGHIAQVAVLPAFKNCQHNSELVAFVSGNREKALKVASIYGIEKIFSYEEFEKALEVVDAVYIALPNHLHCEYALKALKKGKHVLCEKPLAITEEECELMAQAASENNVKLMTAYRLHFEPANLEAIRILKSGEIGDIRLFNSTFTMNVREGDIRVQAKTGGGTLYDIGVYCINAVRYLFQEEPKSVMAISSKGFDDRFKEVDEMTGAVLHFENGKIATFITNFSTHAVSHFEVVGTKGRISMSEAFGYKGEKVLKIERTDQKEAETLTFPQTDQFGPEISYFSDCILNNKKEEPDAREGLLDVRIVEALYKSAYETKGLVELKKKTKEIRPDIEMKEEFPAIKEPKPIDEKGPTAA